jgi:hypothetical protein
MVCHLRELKLNHKGKGQLEKVSMGQERASADNLCRIITQDSLSQEKTGKAVTSKTGPTRSVSGILAEAGAIAGGIRSSRKELSTVSSWLKRWIFHTKMPSVCGGHMATLLISTIGTVARVYD